MRYGDEDGRSGRRGTAGEGGFALVVTLLALMGITLLAGAGYLLSSTDYRINQSHRAATQAFYVADAGLQHFLAEGRARTDTVAYAHPEGSAEVWASRLIDVDEEATLYRVTARGRHEPAEGGVAERTVHAVALLKAAPFNMNSAFTAPPGLVKNGVAGVLSGYDASLPGECPGAPNDLTGLEVPPGGLQVNGAGGGVGAGGGTPPGFFGDPPIDDTQAAQDLLDQTGIDWTALKTGAYATADYVYSQDGYPSFVTDVPLDEWPMVVLDQPSFRVNPTHSGRGTLVVHGDLILDGSFQWDGIILVGGQFISNGFNTVEGAIVAGLNMLEGETVAESQLGNGTWSYQYHSCNVMAALKGIGTLSVEPGTWSEEF